MVARALPSLPEHAPRRLTLVAHDRLPLVLLRADSRSEVYALLRAVGLADVAVWSPSTDGWSVPAHTAESVAAFAATAGWVVDRTRKSSGPAAARETKEDER